MSTATLSPKPAERPELAEWRKQDAVIAKLREEYMPLTINGVDDRKGFAIVHDARMEVKALRVAVEKKRVELKADALAYGKAVDAEAKRLTALLEPIEEHLESQEKAVVEERERIKREAEEARKAKIKARFDELKSLGFQGDYMRVPDLSDEEYATLAVEAKAAKAEADRLAEIERQRLEAEAAEKRRLEAELAEKRRQEEAAAAEQRRKEREALEAERKRLAEEATKLKAEQDRIAAEQAKEAARLREEQRKIELEKARQEAAERARVETEQRLERERLEREEAERRHAEQLRIEAEQREQARIKARQIDPRDTLQQAANKVCQHLPAGWTVFIELARDSGSVELVNSAGETIEYASNNESMADSLTDAVAHAIDCGSMAQAS
jgi:hypothetical protein